MSRGDDFVERQYERTARLIGADAVSLLHDRRVIVFGVGGVGSFAAEALVRAGIGAVDFVDADVVDVTNINRQLVADWQTIGRNKADVMVERALRIQPEGRFQAFSFFYNDDTAERIDLSQYDYVADCIDSVSAKVTLIRRCHEAGVPVISCLGAGNKLDPSRFQVADIAKTSVCPLARVMRKRLKDLGIAHTKVVYSQEPPVQPTDGARLPGSISFVPSAAGLVLAGEIVRNLIGVEL